MTQFYALFAQLQCFKNNSLSVFAFCLSFVTSFRSSEQKECEISAKQISLESGGRYSKLGNFLFIEHILAWQFF